MTDEIAALCVRLRLEGKVTNELLNELPDRVFNHYERWLKEHSSVRDFEQSASGMSFNFRGAPSDRLRIEKIIELLKAHPAESALPASFRRTAD